MYDLDPITLDDGSLRWAIVSHASGEPKTLRVHRHYDDAVAHMRRLWNARMRLIILRGAA
jgi:hypothetical protein